jgi:Protein of unknown function (DUF3455)
MMKSLALLLGLGATFIAGAAVAAPPAAMKFTGRGTQFYSCQQTGTTYAWNLLGPDAHMFNKHGKIVARHFYGPSWQANDGSEIKGKVLVVNAAPSGKQNAPWLVLNVTSEQGAGIFAHVTMVTRTNTQGGGVPASACGAAQQGETVKVPYRARYTLFSQPDAAPSAS